MLLPFLAGQEYYRLSRNELRAPNDPGYPRPLSVWSDVFNEGGISAVIQYQNKRTYFFRGDEYYKFNDRDDEVNIILIVQ